MKNAEPGPDQGAARALSELLLEFGVALNRHGIYPGGHPSLADSERLVVEKLGPLLRERSSVSIGVARRQLVIEGVATDERHPVLRSVAERLHRQHIGAITIDRGVTEAELGGVLRLVAAESEQHTEPLGLGDPERLRAWKHVRLYPMTYDQLELVGDDDGDGAGGTGDSGASQLWLGLARAAVAMEDAEVAGMDAETVARAINDHPAAPAYDQVIVGYLLQLATQLRSTRADPAAPVSRRVSKLINRLEPATLQRLIEMGGDVTQRRKFVLNATDTLATDAVLDVLKAAADTSHQTISSSMLRMLTKLSSNAGSGTRGGAADAALRDQVRDLIREWTLDDPNPGEYTEALERMSRATAATWSMGGASGERDGRDVRDGRDGGGARADLAAGSSSYPAEPLRIVQMALEVDVAGVSFWRAVRHVLSEQSVELLLDLLEETPAASQAASALWEFLESEDSIRVLLTTDPVDFKTLDRLLPRLPRESVTSLLLDRLSESSSRATRMGVFRRLAANGDDVTAAIVERLERDNRWFVQRNMLALLNEIGRVPPDFSALDYATDARPTVRREALQLAARSVLERDRAICIALADDDERAVLVGVRAAQDGLPVAAVPIALRTLEAPAFSAELRLQLLRVLRDVKTAAARDVLLRMVRSGRTLLGRPKLAAATPEVVAALAMLVRGWPDDPAVARVVKRARKSRDPELRQAAQ